MGRTVYTYFPTAVGVGVVLRQGRAHQRLEVVAADAILLQPAARVGSALFTT
jgi:hypothetical protein